MARPARRRAPARAARPNSRRRHSSTSASAMSARLLRILADLGHPAVAGSPDLARSVKVIDLTVGGVRVTLSLTPTASSRAGRSPDMQESARFLDPADQVLEQVSHVLLTYGGHPGCLELMRGTRMKSVAVVFLLQNSVTIGAASLTTSPKPTTDETEKSDRPREAAAAPSTTGPWSCLAYSLAEQAGPCKEIRRCWVDKLAFSHHCGRIIKRFWKLCRQSTSHELHQ